MLSGKLNKNKRGRTVEDLLACFQTEHGAPPAKPVTGTTTVLSTGEVNFVTADFEAGEYVPLCFAPDAKDCKPYIAQGMVMQIRIAA